MLDETTADEALHIARWYVATQLSPSKRFYAKGRFLSDNDLIQDAMLKLLKHKPTEGWNLTTVVCNAVEWSVYRSIERLGFCGRKKAWMPERGNFDVPVECDQKDDLDFPEKLADAISVLPDRLNMVLFARMREVTLQDISKQMKVSRERVRQLEVKCIERFRRQDCARTLEQFVDPLAVDAEIERRNPPRKQPEFLPTNRHSNASHLQAVADMERDRPTMQDIRDDFFQGSVPAEHDLASR